MKLRLPLFWFLYLSFFLFLFFRLFQLTVIEGIENRSRAENQRIKLQKIVAPRGIIFDTLGNPLVKNIPLFKKCDTERKNCQTISREEALSMEEQGQDAQLAMEIGRRYVLGEATAHLLGYLGETSEEEVEKKRLEMGEMVGRTGIEEQYEEVLKGVDGAFLIETDTQGKTVRVIGEKESIPGSDITLSLDSRLQSASWEALKGYKGAIIIQKAGSGEILALVSSPSFDPANLEVGLFNDPSFPFFNRAISGVYPPGSTFKIVTAAAGLEEGKITPETLFLDTGEIRVGEYRYTNWYFTQYGQTEGEINLVTAIKRSTDTFFYKVGEWVGAEKLLDWGKIFGLGRILGIDLPGEVAGFWPDPESKLWFLGNTYHLAIGQGDLGLTPLQVNTMTGVIASGGKLCKPKILKNGSSCEETKIKKETLFLIKEGMKEACSPGGTAFPFFDFSPQVACKTGTAEFNDPKGRTHAWLTAFAPVDNPEIVVTALVEGGGEGSSVAGPMVKKVLEEYFKK